jgi:hypothetical protein
MKINKLACAAVLLVALGFLLPDFITDFLDENINKHVSERAFADPVLSLPAENTDFIDALYIYRYQYKSNAVEYADDSAASQAIVTAMSALSYFAEKGLINASLWDYEKCSMQTVFAYRKDHSSAQRVVWELTFSAGVYDFTVIIDDSTKKLLAFSIPATPSSVWGGEPSDPTAAINIVQNWADALTQYYGFAANRANLQSEYTPGERCDIAFSHASGEAVTLPIIVGAEYIAFNR